MATVNMDDLKPNSNVYREAEISKREKLDPVIKKDSVVSTKKPFGQKLKDTFIGEDIQDIKRYILVDVIIPGVKRTILSAIRMMFFGEPEDDHYYERNSSRHTDYAGRYKGRSYSSSSLSYKSRDRERRYEDEKVDYRNIILRNREDAEDVVDEMKTRIRKYGSCSVADLFDLINVAGKYTDNNWGWRDERDIGIRRVNSGFLLDVTEAEYLDD